MLDEVRRFIKREKMLRPAEPVWVAVSGGLDSMVLLHVMRALGYPCTVAHVDHGLRGGESDADAAFVRKYCETGRIPFRMQKVDVAARMRSHGGSVQMAARDLRYAWFADLHREASWPILLAHHADDAVETLFIHLLRGTGTKGWSAIKPVSGIHVRPFLGVHREAIAAYAEEHRIPFREDSSNSDPKYLRNRVRKELMPLLEDLRPGARGAIARSLELLRELEQAGTRESSAALAMIAPPVDGVVTVPFELIEGSATPGLVLHQLLRREGFHPDVLLRIRDAIAERATGAAFMAGDRQVRIDREALILGPAAQVLPTYTIDPVIPWHADGPFSWSMEEGGLTAVPSDMHVVWLDGDRLAFPVLLRPWQAGDRMRPVGLDGSKLVSDILTDAKVAVQQRPGIYVLVSGDEIAWLVGHRIGSGFQATTASHRVLRCVWGRP